MACCCRASISHDSPSDATNSVVPTITRDDDRRPEHPPGGDPHDDDARRVDQRRADRRAEIRRHLGERGEEVELQRPEVVHRNADDRGSRRPRAEQRMVGGEHVGRADGEVGGVTDRDPVLDGGPDDGDDERNQRGGEAGPLEQRRRADRSARPGLVHCSVGAARRRRRWRSASKHSTVVAIATLRLSARPRCSMRTHSSIATSASSPAASLPATMAIRPLQSADVCGVPAVRRRPDQAQSGRRHVAERRAPRPGRGTGRPPTPGRPSGWSRRRCRE